MAIVTGLILLVVGLVACFYGLRFYRAILGLLGFGVGYYAAAGFLVGQSDIVQIIVSIVAGLVVGFVFYSLYKFSYVVFGAILGLAIGGIISAALNLEGVIMLVVALVLGVIGALVGNSLADIIIRLSTSFAGSVQAIGGVAALAAALNIPLPLADPTHGGVAATGVTGVVTLVAVVVLGVIGYLFQARHAPQA